MKLFNKFIIITTLGADGRHEKQENHIEIK